MEVWLRRLFWLFTLIIGACGTLAFTVAFIQKGPPSRHESWLYLWPVTSIAVSILAFAAARRAFRQIPEDWPGLLQLSLTDLLATSFLTGTMLTALSMWFPDIVLAFDAPVSLIFAFGFAIGLLVSSRVGLQSWRLRYLYALSFSTRSLAIVFIAALFLVLSMLLWGWAETTLRVLGPIISPLNRLGSPAAIFGLPLLMVVGGHLLCLWTATTVAKPQSRFWSHEDHG
ncbi:MAG TPA: hypothetical protein VGP72_29050 [Planctomycetota bacterium]|jgi:hypothetical protein